MPEEKKKETPEDRSLVVYQSRDGQEIKLSFDTIRKYLVSGRSEFVTDQELKLFMGTCKSRGLNPFKKDVYLIKYTQNDAAATIVSIDYFRSRAKAQHDCKGWQSGVIVMTGDDKIEYRKGAFMLDGDELLGGWFRAKPAGWDEEYEWSVNLRSFVKKTREGQVTKFWAEDNQPQQIAKVAESQGLRRIWPDEFQGLSVEGDQVLDITPTEPLKTPQPLQVEKKADVRKDDSAAKETKGKLPEVGGGNEHANSGAGKAARSEPTPQSKAVAEPDGSVETKPSPEGIAILAIDGYEKESWPGGEVLKPLIKDLNEEGKARVCRYFNMRKREVVGV